MEILRVKIRKDGIKYLIVPKKSKIKQEDLVLVTNNLKLINKFQKEDNENGN
jgi:hypothetical protein